MLHACQPAATADDGGGAAGVEPAAMAAALLAEVRACPREGPPGVRPPRGRRIITHAAPQATAEPALAQLAASQAARPALQHALAVAARVEGAGRDGGAYTGEAAAARLREACERALRHLGALEAALAALACAPREAEVRAASAREYEVVWGTAKGATAGRYVPTRDAPCLRAREVGRLQPRSRCRAAVTRGPWIRLAEASSPGVEECEWALTRHPVHGELLRLSTT